MITTRLACLCVAMLSVTGCGGSTFVSLARKQMDLSIEVRDILQDVTDEASAKAAVDKLKTVRDKNDALKAQLKALNPKPTPGDESAIREKYNADYVELVNAIHSEETRI